jgi:prepilin-type N-terminal cleavage/methylation domain-containing protein
MKRNTRGPRAANGYTLIELMVVISLMAITAMLVAPSLAGTIREGRVGSALDQVVSDVAYARMLAVKDGVRTRVDFTAPATYSISRLPPSGSPVVVRTVNLTRDYPGLAFDLDDGLAQLEFTSRGLVSNLADDQIIKVSNESARDSVLVSAAGRVYRPS